MPWCQSRQSWIVEVSGLLSIDFLGNVQLVHCGLSLILDLAFAKIHSFALVLRYFKQVME